MANRFKNERIEIKLTKEEKEIFEKKMAYFKLSLKQNFEGDLSRSPQAKSAPRKFRFRV